MKFIIKGPFKENFYTLMRRINYFYQKKQNNEFSFVRPPKGYPRFHLLVKIEGEDLILNLHLDQKRPVYEAAPAHAAQYNTEVVSREVKRIKQILLSAKNQ